MNTWTDRVRGFAERVSPGLWTDPGRARQRQFLVLGLLAGAMVAVLWLMFTLAGGGAKKPPPRAAATDDPANVTNLGVMAPGDPVTAVDKWVGTAGRKLAQYENDKDEQSRINRDAKTFEDGTLKRFADLEQRLTSVVQSQVAGSTSAPTGAPVSPASDPLRGTSSYPPDVGLPPGLPRSRALATPLDMPPGMPGLGSMGGPESASAQMTRVSLVTAAAVPPDSIGSLPSTSPNAVRTASGAIETGAGAASARSAKGTLESFLPIGFTRGVLLTGLDAPTGGQAQSNPHPVLIRLSDTSVLPNEYRADYSECFIVASGYGDISSERAYMRTGLLSCIRPDGQTLEVELEGNVFGEDGKYGLRGRLVSKQGQMLANALLAGVVSGIGQGFATANTTYSTSALGSIATTTGSQAYRAGIGVGVGKALDRLAQYYIKLAEQTFPVIEVDAGREVDVVVTRGVRIDAGSLTAGSEGGRLNPVRTRGAWGLPGDAGASGPVDSYFKGQGDEDY